MQTATFYGSSDDLIEVSGIKGAKEFYADGTDDSRIAGAFNLGGKMRVYAIYDGCWSFAVGQVDDEIPLPNWPIRVYQSAENTYSMELAIDVPDDVKLFRERNEE
jgi:hypothetical protein